MAANDAPEDLSQLTVEKLRERLRARGLKQGGRKSELVARLRDEAPAPAESGKSRKRKRAALSDEDAKAESGDDDDDDGSCSEEGAPRKKRVLAGADGKPGAVVDADKEAGGGDGEQDAEAKEEEEQAGGQGGGAVPRARADGDIVICCYNVNGVRAAARKALGAYLAEEDADMVCFSEMKAEESQNPCDFASAYPQVVWNACTEKKGYAGTCLLSKTAPLSVVKGIGASDAQGRAITVEYPGFYLVNTYVPNSGSKLKFEDRRRAWDKAMLAHLVRLQATKPVVWTGDLNVAVLDYDVYDGETNKQRPKSAGFTPYERANFRRILKETGMVDAYRHFYPDARVDAFTFFTMRSAAKNMKKEGLGWRLDYFVVSASLLPLIANVEVRKEASCSDHVPLVLTMRNPPPVAGS